MSPKFLNLVLLASLLSAAEMDRPTGNRTTPPTLNSVSPLGLARGTTSEITVEGLNLARASAIYFSEPGITGKIVRIKELPDLADVRLGSNGTVSTIDLGPLPPRNQVTVEVQVSSKTAIGPVAFRLKTPLGTTPEGRFLVEPYYGETADNEPNDTIESAVETFLPTILTGAISKPGDVDTFKIKVSAGEQLVFENGAAAIGSTLQAVVEILAQDQSVLQRFGTRGGMDAIRFAYRFEKAGTYYVRVSDYQHSGKSSNFYRIKAGNFALVDRAYPLGLQAGQTREIALAGWNLAPATVKVEGKANAGNPDTIKLRPDGAFNEVKLALGQEPEIEGAGNGQLVSVPVTINGRLEKAGSHAEYRFHARKGQKLILDVNARRLGSDLDSFLEVLDAAGKPIERAVVRATWDTATALSDRDSATPGIRILSWTDLKPGDYMMMGNEINQVATLPKGPDEDTFFEQFGGQRLAYFDTSTEDHAADKPAYKVHMYPPGAKFSNNGLPLVHLYYQNDDGGPGYGKDSLVHFTAPADGDYIARLRDTEGLGGANFAYRLTIREPRPDFRLALSNRNPNVPAGSCVPETVTALRMDEFDGPIDVAVTGLPDGLRATSGVIAPGQVSTALILCAAENVKLTDAAALTITGKANGLMREANPDDRLKLVSTMPKPDVLMTSETKEITVEQGGTAEITVNIRRENDFGGRVPIEVRNLPPHVFVPDVGLNGILLNENESRRTFKIQALPDARPGEQLLYVSGVVETRSPLPSIYSAPQPVRLKIVARTVAAR